MPNALYFTPADGTEIALHVAGANDGTHLLSEEGWDAPPDEVSHVAVGDPLARLDGGAAYDPRVYVARFRLVGESASHLRTLARQWVQWHLPSRGVGLLRRVALDGASRTLSARPRRGTWRPHKGHALDVAQPYEAAVPWWHGAQESASGTMNGATPVAIACQVSGDLDAQPVITLTGLAHTPTLTAASGESLTVDHQTANADDVLLIDTRRGQVSLTYYEHGGGDGVSWLGYRTTDSAFFSLPPGATPVTVAGAAGETSTAAVGIAWRPRYGGV